VTSTERKPRAASQAKQRLDEIAYQLFCERGINAVGIDELIEKSGVARMTLYRHYKSKEDLILAFLDLRVKRWAFDWLAGESTRRARNPRTRLLTIFDLFDEWFQESDFRGCQVVNVLIQSEFGGRPQRAAAGKLADLRIMLASWASEAGFENSAALALSWHSLMMGSIIAAQSGEMRAAITARRTGELILKSWPRKEALPKKPSRSPIGEQNKFRR